MTTLALMKMLRKLPKNNKSDIMLPWSYDLKNCTWPQRSHMNGSILSIPRCWIDAVDEPVQSHSDRSAGLACGSWLCLV